MSVAPAVLNFVASDQPYRERQRVCRLEAFFDPELGMRFGHVIRIYSSLVSTDPRHPRHELYEVLWDNGAKEDDLLRHALHLVPLEESEIVAREAFQAAVAADVEQFQKIIWE
ncbi:hypothetical protein [Pseudomonas sp. PLMAX]|uniref:hypothetical protein n=1 Tax=Pseudomonas sp. PLMAX TaxID=2201998 RepID=UPI0038B8345C